MLLKVQYSTFVREVRQSGAVTQKDSVTPKNLSGAGDDHLVLVRGPQRPQKRGGVEEVRKVVGRKCME